MYRTLLFLLYAIFSSFPSYGQIPDNPERKWFLEARPIQFVLNGYSIVGHYAVNDRMQIGASIFAATLSDGITDLIWDSKGPLDLEAKQDIVFGLSYRYFLGKNKSHRGFFTGAAAGAEFYTLTNRDDRQELPYTFYYVAPRLGYMWYPLRKKAPNFYISGEAVVVVPIITDGTVSFNSEATTEINRILTSPLVGIGYRF